MTDLIPYVPPTDSWVGVLGDVGDLAGKLARTPFVPRAMQGQPAAVAAAILTGREMGLGPMASLRGIDVIEGRPALTAQMLAARILAAGHRITWVQTTDQRVTVRIERGDGLSEGEATWALADAQRAGLAGKKVWQQYPRHMLRARALSECAAMVCPDVALGLDVGADTADGPASGPAPVTVVQLGPPPPPAAPHGSVWEAQDAPQAPRAPQAPETPQDAPQAPEPASGSITSAQTRRLGWLIGEWERVRNGGTRIHRDERRALIADLAGHPGLGSAKDLTAHEASAAMDNLAALIDTPAPDTAASVPTLPDVTDAELVTDQ